MVKKQVNLALRNKGQVKNIIYNSFKSLFSL